MSYYYGYKIRLYPTKEQEKVFLDHVYGCRWMWNYLLNLHETVYKESGMNLSEFDMNKIITELGEEEKSKEEKDRFLDKVSVGSLQRISRDLTYAYKKFFNKTANKPHGKSKKDAKDSFPVRCDRFYFKNEEFVQIPMAGLVRYHNEHDDIPLGNHVCNFYDVRIHRNVRGTWLLTFTVKRENQALEDFDEPLNDATMGIDLGTHKLATVQFGEKTFVVENVNNSRKMRKRIRHRKHIQRVFSRKKHKMYERVKSDGTIYYEPSKNFKKTKKKLQKLYDREHNIRVDYTHKVTSELVRLLPKEVVMEDLDIQAMLKNKHLAESISNANWYRFTECMRYKCENRGIQFKQAPRNYPSSKTCSNCGYVHTRMKTHTKDRLFECPNCGFTIDRDINAATNLMNYFK